MISTTRHAFKRKGSQYNHYEQLETIRRIATIKAVGATFVNGITNKYDAKFPKEL